MLRTVLARSFCHNRARHKLRLTVISAGQWPCLAFRCLHYDIPGLNRRERAYVEEQTATIVNKCAGGAALPAEVASSGNWKFLESEFLTRRYVSALKSFDITVSAK